MFLRTKIAYFGIEYVIRMLYIGFVFIVMTLWFFIGRADSKEKIFPFEFPPD